MAFNFKYFQLIILTVIIYLVDRKVQCEIYTSLAHMEQMVKVEDVVLTNLKSYVENQRKNLQFLKL